MSDPDSNDFSDGSWSPGVYERDENGRMRCVRAPRPPRDEDEDDREESRFDPCVDGGGR